MALIPVSVYAAGLGKLNVSSGLGEPLRAEIELLSVSPEELSSITAAIAPQEAYSAQGIERPASHGTIKVDVTKNPNGAPVLKLRSSQPINDPFLDMLLQVDWSSGRLLREYTVLLDPPGYTGESEGTAQSTVQAPTAVPAGAITEATDTQATASGSSGKPSKSKRVKKPAAEAAGDTQEYVTQRGDTLAKIARDMKPEGVSLEQMLIGLYEANPDAFAGKNINRLKTGQILRAPSQESLNAISQQQANNEVRVHSANWNEYRNKLAGMVVEAPVAEAEINTSSTSGKIKTAEDQSLAEAAGSKDVVKLSTGETAKAKDDGTLKSLEAKVAALQEEVTAREKGLQEAQIRTSELEKQIADMQKLLAIKNGTMAEMQKQAEQASEPKPAEAAPQPPVAQPSPVPSEPKSAEQQKPTESSATATKQEKPKAAIAPVPEPVAEESFLDSLNLPLLGGATGLLALLGGSWIYLRNKRKKNLADFEQGIMTSGGLKANTVFGNTSGSSVDTGDTSFLTDFSQSANGGMIDTHDVDPIAEAEVYMAYGRDAQAEEILKDAISKEPKRYELHLKLLEMYAASKNMSAFETVAGELYTTLGGQDPVWAKVAALGAQLEPNNPLYQSNAPVGGSDQPLDASDFADSPIAQEKDLDFGLGDDASSETTAPSQEDEFAVTPPSDEKSDELEFVSFSTQEQTPATSSGIDFDMGSLGGSEESATPEVPSTLGFSNTLPDLEMASESTIGEVSAPGLDMATTETMPTISTFSQDGQDNVLNFEITTPSLATGEESPADMGFEITHAEPVTFEVPSMNVNTTSHDTADHGITLDMTTLDLSDTQEAGDDKKVMDMSGISLDIEETPSQAINLTLSADEPTEVDTKLDLVAAYLDMDDKVGAKELLDEVMKEGGPAQRKRAEEILQTLA
ncbi:MAG TPA: FimV/HubP family polar landmark protein [Methylophilus sp.]|nr:FimV/HubP family polar landmark protein [Methylophilus sp.]